MAGDAVRLGWCRQPDQGSVRRPGVRKGWMKEANAIFRDGWGLG